MNCWKAFNISKEYGSFKLTLLSLLGSLFFYMIYYLIFENEFIFAGFSGLNLVILLAVMLLVWPAHKFLHILPVILSGKRASLSLGKSRGSTLPYIYTNIYCTLKKKMSILMVISPGIIITALSILAAVFMPGGVYYFVMIGALNFGLSMKDLIYLIHLISAPADAFIEDDRTGCKILIKEII